MSCSRPRWTVAVLLAAACLAPAGVASGEDLVGEIFKIFGGNRAEPARRPEALDINKIVAAPGFANEFTPLLTRVLGGELHFVRKVCEPTPEQLQQLREVGKARVAVISKHFSQLQQNSRSPSEWPDPRTLLAETLQQKIDELLPPEAAERYRDEVAARDLARRQAAEGMMLVLVDRKLCLSGEQYEQAAAAIDKSWKEPWSRNMQIYLYDEYAPVPDAAVLKPLLNAEQQRIWAGRVNHGMIHFGWEQDLGLLPWGDDGIALEVEEAAQPADPAPVQPGAGEASAGDRL
jgi:hypothetical protein